MPNEHKSQMLRNTAAPGSKRNWVSQDKFAFFVKSAYDTESGDISLNSDLPLSEADIKRVYDAAMALRAKN